MDRLAASIGQLDELVLRFEGCLDVPNGGVLLALPALLAMGLLDYAEKYFKLPKGYYRLDTIFLLLACMALARIKTVEALRYCAPGEWGKLLGMDRIPEAKTLREKIGLLSESDAPSLWAAELCSKWMQGDPTSAAVLCIDGHVRVYHGHQTTLPRHYVSRQRLCLRATTDYWVNALDGQPFMVINKEVDPGLIQVLEGEIVPRLEKDVPHTPTANQLEANPLLHRFTLIFDREGYSPDLFLRMRNKRIACVTYHKFPKGDWPQDEFTAQEVTLACGHVVTMFLAERGVYLANKLWVREIRKWTESGHQTAILTTDYSTDRGAVAAAMFARWSQENFFRYMRQHYNLDGIVEHSTEAIPDTTRLINPEYRRLDNCVRSRVGVLTRRLAEYGAKNLDVEIEPKKVEAYQQKMADLQEGIADLKKEVEALKGERKEIKQHITMAELPEQEQFQRLRTQSKYLIDTIKMIAYRAETAMANVIGEKMSHPNEARSLLRAVYSSEADLFPDHNAGTLTVRLHQLANQTSAEAVLHLCDELNATETVFPGTNLRLVYELVSK